MKESSRALFARLRLLVAVVTAMVAFSATAAMAAPTEPTMDLDELQTVLDSAEGNMVDGYMKTVVKGSDIIQLTVRIRAITGGSGENSSLILFESQDALIDELGGIASGMSGSPIFVPTGEGDKLIGAVAYGESFSRRGTGLATPIEYMSAIEASYPLIGVQELPEPMLVNGSVINKIIVAPDPERYAGAAKEGALVADPLNSVFIGGLNPNLKAYKQLAKMLEARGMRVVPVAARLGAGGNNASSFSADLEGGAGIAVLGARGDMWYGAVGTVTYENAGSVVALGHPAWWNGATSRFMHNAWVDDIWPSNDFPYKMARPGALRGEIQQDRMAGIAGVTDVFAAETTITAHATLGARSKDTTTVATRQLMSEPGEAPMVAAMGAYVAGEGLFDSVQAPGSAQTTTTIVVGVKGKPDVEHTIKIRNVVDDASDIRYASVEDVLFAVDNLTGVTENGLEVPEIKSIHLDSAFSTSRIGASVVDVKAPNGLKHGSNVVQVTLLKHGEAAPRTVTTSLYIPANVPLTGTIVAGSAALPPGMDDEDWFDEPTTDEDRRSIAQVVADLNSTKPNNVLSIEFHPESLMDDSDEAPATVTQYAPITTNVKTDWYISGGKTKVAPLLLAGAMPGKIKYKEGSMLSGALIGADKGTVTVYATTAGSTERVLATVPLQSLGGMAEWEVLMASLKKNTAIRVRFNGDDGAIAAQGTTKVYVAAKVKVKSSDTRVARGRKVKLTTSVYPNSTVGGTVVFERYDKKYGFWRKIATQKLAMSGTTATAKVSWRPKVGTNKVRVRYTGGLTNIKSKSTTLKIYVK